ncbi:MAG: Nif11 domain/cupin domain-containing protein [Prochlorococcus sp.]|jgi:cupin 2 domain-containing protein
MAEQDLHRFLDKVQQLQKMVHSLEELPERRELLAACSDHNHGVQLARSWGFEIGRRWGELDPVEQLPSETNLLARALPPEGQEQHHLLHTGSDWRLELILSCSASSPEGFWYDQTDHEWIVILRGSASLKLKDPDAYVDLSVGDQLHFLPHRLHRVERTDPHPGTIWLALFWTQPKHSDGPSLS